MEIFNLPPATIVNRVIPKNAFDRYTTTRQKKLFTDLILRITWIHKLSPETINLESKEIIEIQIFRIELKTKENITSLLEVIDKAVPYPIIFIVEYNGNVYLSTSPKHPHPVNSDNCIIDWTFTTDWFTPASNSYRLELQKNLDAIYQEFCVQLSGNLQFAKKSIQELIDHSRLIDSLRKEIARLKASIVNSQQFKQKVELNLRLKAAEMELRSLLMDSAR
ncbi:DUF4391 domain-containing protein [Niastella caeni]|uniref:DUF4391 domain-containing protein n=1 Tax=Niastella caeni TaxID=2569763 RepID=A0A4S8HTG2_9BACT|nr:DUF4391 domain-containing protein [Niastella caeni]THU38321.1 DUF4391 domain-containing protein [Niastella caeni]